MSDKSEKNVFDDLEALRQEAENEEPVASPKATKKKDRVPRYVGCSFEWLKLVLPHIKSRNQLAVALLMYRRMKVCGSKTFSFPNAELNELGIDRHTKSRVLTKLKRAGIIKTKDRLGFSIKVKMFK